MRALILVAVVAGCGSSGPTTIEHTFDPCALAFTTAATGDQLASIDQAIALWHATVAADAPAVAVEFAGASPIDYGLYDDHSSTIFVNLTLEAPQRTITLAHEFGHAFGLFHVTDRESVMNPGNLKTAPNAGDLAAVEALWGACK